MKIISDKTIYLDYASATPLDEKVAKNMSALGKDLFANPSAIHKGGIRARKAIEDARESIANLIHAHSDEIVFTGSGTESIALAIIGVINNENKKNIIPHIIISNIEHSAVLETIRTLEKNKKIEVTYIECNDKGLVDPKDIKKALKDNTVLVSVMYANNEIGTIQPIQEIAKEIRHFKKIGKIDSKESIFPIFHTDACQAMNYLHTSNIEKLGVDLLSFNGSKIYGPKGVGILFKKRGISLVSLYGGGGQEQGLRSGTENTVSIIAIAQALEITCAIKEKESLRLIKLRDYGIGKLLALSKSGYEIILNGDKEKRLPNNINISIIGISSELLVIELDARGISVSERSACGSTKEEGSHVIRALHHATLPKGLSFGKEDTLDSLRISLGRATTKGDIDALVFALKQILAVYRKWK